MNETTRSNKTIGFNLHTSTVVEMSGNHNRL